MPTSISLPKIFIIHCKQVYRSLNLLTVDELVRTNLHMMNSDMLDKIYENGK